MRQKHSINDDKTGTPGSQWLDQIFSFQRQMNESLWQLIPGPFSSSCRDMEDQMLDALQKNMSQMYETVRGNQKYFTPWLTSNDAKQLEAGSQKRKVA